MHHHTGFSAWVTIDGKEAVEYATESSEDGKTVTCWIASELGKRFSVHWTNSVYRQDTLGQVSMDGTYSAGKFIYGNTLPKSAYCEGVSDASTLKPFIFSSLELTDDDAFLGSSLDQELGVIQLVIVPTQISSLPSSSHSIKSRSLSEKKVHERTKKAVTQQIKLGEAEQLTKPSPFRSWHRAGPDLVKLCFKYRPLDVLQANGIAPLSPRLHREAPAVSAAPTPDDDLLDVEEENNLRERLKALEAKRFKKEKKPSVKRELEPGAIIDLTRPSKKVKREAKPFVSGEVIDLT